MLLRVLSFLIVLFYCSSCDHLMGVGSLNTEVLDTVVDYSVVDVSPSFKACDSIIDKSRKSLCFRNTIHQKISNELIQHHFTIRDSINEVIFVDLLINSKGIITLEKMNSSKKLKEELPLLAEVLQKSIEKLPMVKSAIKQGIPVTTKYRLPIKIQWKE